MANLEVNAASSVCRKCGRAYGRLKGYFPVCYAYLYKGTGYLPYCNDCVKGIFDAYYAECGDERLAVRQMCRKFDLYWSDDMYEKASHKTSTRTIVQNYISRLNNASFAGKSYDDTLREENRMWRFWDSGVDALHEEARQEEEEAEESPALSLEPIEITEDIIAFWGPGYTTEMYRELEQRLRYYTSQMDEDEQMDMGTEALLRQIAMMEIDINKARAAGTSVDKMVNSLNSLLSSLKKPSKKEQASVTVSNQPFGVLIKCIEDRHPIQDREEESYLIKYIRTWFFGPICKMLGIKNFYCRMYEEEMERLRVEKPEYNDEDDDTFLYDYFEGVELDRRDISLEEDIGDGDINESG